MHTVLSSSASALHACRSSLMPSSPSASPASRRPVTCSRPSSVRHDGFHRAGADRVNTVERGRRCGTGLRRDARSAPSRSAFRVSSSSSFDKPWGMQSCRIAQLEQRALRSARLRVAARGVARRLARGAGEVTCGSRPRNRQCRGGTRGGNHSDRSEHVLSRWSGGNDQIVPSARVPVSRQNDAFRQSGTLSSVTPASVNLCMDC
jgi:hypothetical protein